MTAQEKIQKVTEISQSKGWSISVDDKNKSNIQFDFQRYTNYGQDFNFSAEMKCEDIDTLIADMEQYFEGFDPDYEAYLWIGNDGHGKKWRTLPHQGHCIGYGGSGKTNTRLVGST
jgi:hypothetical protein